MAHLESRGVRLSVNGDDLEFDAPRDVWTQEVEEAVRHYKRVLMAYAVRRLLNRSLADRSRHGVLYMQWALLANDLEEHKRIPIPESELAAFNLLTAETAGQEAEATTQREKAATVRSTPNC